ncbi:endopeptidase La [Candidatus Dependentiae bacterium]|nr:MAG: endopeptidase La [Candidatus Dependentiae bacterium]
MKSSTNTLIKNGIPEILPVIPTMDIVVFPHMLVPLLVLDERIINGINQTLEGSKMVLLLAAKTQTENHQTIGTKDLYSVGTIASIMRMIKIPEGGLKILIQGLSKANATELIATEECLMANIEAIAENKEVNQAAINAQINSIKELDEEISRSGQSFSPDFHMILSKMIDPEKISDFILSHLTLTVEQAQELLEKDNLLDLLEGIYQYLAKEAEISELQENIRGKARDSMNKAQKEFYLREQIRALKRELGEDDTEEIEIMLTKLEQLNVPEEVNEEIKRQIYRLEKTSSDSMEAAVLRNYLDCIFALPWNNETEDNLDIPNAKKILDEDHYGLKEVKERILDFISIRNLKKDGHSPILCFVGPPGTGKTSLGQSIARSIGRNYSRISLGGVKDEAEIRGHRRTYVGAMPGRFIQAIRKAGSCNPVIIIDELDKIGADFRGDPSAAMLEVLDPQQNKTFYDNYLGLPFDFSKVLFIATANTLDPISEPLRDRMEIIELSGYTTLEKLHIAKRHLIQKTIMETGLQEHYNFEINDSIISDIIHNYTRESGVRQLERILNKLCAKVARSLVEEQKLLSFTTNNLEQYLGPRKFLDDEVCQKHQIGISNGLAWTIYGGEIIKIEAILIPGTGKLILTGQLGDVMKESAQAAMSYARAHAQEFKIDDILFKKNDLHIHIPAGATPKDGPSAGITMLAAILSALTQRPINAHYAMTGELNLRGEIMPIGGIKEKILAAKRNKVEHIILPLKNKHDLIGLEEITEDIDLIWVNHANEVLQQVLMPDKNKPPKRRQK